MSNGFIDGLVATAQPVTPRRPAFDYAIVAMIGALEFLGIAVFLDFGYLGVLLDAEPLRMGFKISLFGTLAFVLAAMAVASLAPEARHIREWSTVVFAAAIVSAVAIFDRSMGESVQATLMPQYGVGCSGAIVGLALPVVLGLALLMARGATTQPRRSALLIGLAGGAFGAFLYALQCPFVGIWYLGLWYALPVVVVGVASALILPRVMRW